MTQNLITGSSGLLGSHIAEQLAQRGEVVRCLVRRTSDTSFLDTLKVEKVYGDVTDPSSLRDVFKDVDIVYHCAAKVTDWGPWKEFEKATVQGTKNCLEVAMDARVKRFLYVSTESVYGYHQENSCPTDEKTPFAKRLWWGDFYDRAKKLTEGLVWDIVRTRGLVTTVIRPGWIYGPRDTVFLKRLIQLIQSPLGALINGGSAYINLVYAADAANAAILAANKEIACNQVYNVNTDERITVKDIFETIASLLGERFLYRSISYRIAYMIATIFELVARLRRSKIPPLLTRYGVIYLGRSHWFSAEKARQELEWFPRVSFKEGMKKAVEWYLQTHRTGAKC